MPEERYSDPEKFEDPLENYEPKVYGDRLEEALAEQTVEEIAHRPYASVSPDATVQEAVEKLAGLQVACLLVEKDGALVGVFSHRDVLDKVCLEFDSVKNDPVGNLMTTDPAYVFETDPAAAAFAVTAVCGFRHVPVVNLEHRLVGIVSPQRVTSYLHTFFEKG